ncbi:MAG TPA: hypothetical protein VHX65_06750 [Pirellulales bacterium]|jgi:hypothetical protein|nr:hypothetical protein [Pirellulales bacterium]
MLALCLCWCATAVGADGILANFIAAQQAPGGDAGTAATQTPPGTVEEVPPAPGQGEPIAPGQEVGVPAVPVSAMDGILPPGPMLADGQAIPPTASTRDWFDFHNWYSQDDFTILNHPKPKRNVRLLFDFADAENQFFTDNLGLGITPGARLTLGYILDREKFQDHSVEVTYEGPDVWNKLYSINAAQGSVFSIAENTSTVGSLDNSLNQFLGGFNGVDTYLIKYQSDLNSIEINYRVRSELSSDQLVYDPDAAIWVRRVENGLTFSYLVGFRDVELNERLNESAFRFANFVGPASGSYNVKVNNSLAALQFGGELDYQYQRFFVAVRGSIAPAINFAEQMSNIQSTDPVLGGLNPLALKASNDGPACISEFRLEGGYEIRPNVRLRLTYDFQWLTSIALATSQLSLSSPNPGKIIVSNDMMLNGLSAGIDFSW